MVRLQEDKTIKGPREHIPLGLPYDALRYQVTLVTLPQLASVI